MSPRSKRTYPTAVREKALARAAEIGAAATARETGIPVATIYGWRQEKGEVGPPSRIESDPVARAEWAAKKEAGAAESWDEAKAALALVRQRLAEGAEGRAKTAALTFAILADKSAMLEQASALEEERKAKMSQAQVEAIAACLMNVVTDLGLPQSHAVAELFRHHLAPLEVEGTMEDRAVGPAPSAEKAREDLRAKYRDELRREELRREPDLELEAESIEDAWLMDATEPERPLVEPPAEPDHDPGLVQGNTCPNCGEEVPGQEMERHLAGLDESRLFCPRQDIEAINRRAKANESPPW